MSSDMTTIKGFLAAIAASLVACMPEPESPAFEIVDSDGDGAISQEEAAAVNGLDFAAADTDQNGSLSPEEYEAQ